MTPQEKRLEMIKRIEDLLMGQYERVELNGENCFLKKDGTVFHLCGLGGKIDALVIEYADTAQEANKNRYEDGDLFYMDELNDGEMFQKMIDEIEK